MKLYNKVIWNASNVQYNGYFVWNNDWSNDAGVYDASDYDLLNDEFEAAEQFDISSLLNQ